MKKYVAGIIVLFALSTLSWSQGTKESFDTRKSKAELEIMRGILNTTLNFVSENAPKGSPRLRFSNIKAFYLNGQGAVFVITAPGISGFGPYLGIGNGFGSGIGGGIGGGISGGIGEMDYEDFSEDVADLTREAAELGREAAYLSSRIGADSAVEPPAPPAPPAPPVQPAPPAPPAASSKAEKAAADKLKSAEVKRQDLRQQLEKIQQRAKQAREQVEANRQKLAQALTEVQGHLIETLANYGDSITTVKPDEYVNLVLVSDEFDSKSGRSDVISARKSWITDYKAGRLTLEAFKQKVIQYKE